MNWNPFKGKNTIEAKLPRMDKKNFKITPLNDSSEEDTY